MVTEWITKQDSYLCCVQETHFRLKDTHRLKVMETIFQENEITQNKKAGVAILLPEKTDFKTEDVTGDKEGPSNSNSVYLSEETQNIKSKRHIHPYVYCNII